ncbi:hypothetical protein ACFTWD_22150 [Streptomyces sp. NPDC056943]
MTRTKRFLAAAFLAAAVAVGTATPALANIHVTSTGTNNLHVT